MSVRVTLVIPTLNRPALLRRQLNYYKKTGFKGEILIADSTEGVGYHATSILVAEFSSILSLKHYHLPELSFAGAILKIIKEVQTPYVAVIPDDDFLIVSGIERCVNFLDNDNKFIAAHGLGIWIGSDDGGTDTISVVGHYPLPVLLNNTGSDRVINHLENYKVTLFSIHRTEIWVKIFSNTPSAIKHPLCCDRAFSDELLQCALTAVYGKVAQIEGLYLVRQTHNTRNFLPAWYKWLTSERWWPSYISFRDKVAGALVEIDGVSLSCAQKTIDFALSQYLYKSILLEMNESRGKGINQFIKRWMPKEGLPVLRWMRSRILFRRLSLIGLMRPASPYHRDFLSVYNSVINDSGVAKRD